MPDTKELLRETRDRVVPPSDVIGSLERRRHHRGQVRRVEAAVVAFAVALAGLAGWLAVKRDAGPVPSSPVDLGIFAEVRGWIAFGRLGQYLPGIWALDPANPQAEPVLLDPHGGFPLAWSRDGSKLLLLIPRDPASGYQRPFELVVLNANGTETHIADV